jgi:hypothetical protein
MIPSAPPPPHTGVAVEAEAGLSSWAASGIVPTEELLKSLNLILSAKPVGEVVDQCAASLVLGSASSTVRMRLLSILVSVAARGGRQVAEAVGRSGERSTRGTPSSSQPYN